MENQYLQTYLKIVRYRSVVFPKAEHVAKFNIVPGFWYKVRKLKVNSSAENTIFVTLEEEAKLYLVLLYYFMSVDDHVTYKRILAHLNRKVVCLGFGTLRQVLGTNGMLPERVVSAYVEHWSRHTDGHGHVSRSAQRKGDSPPTAPSLVRSRMPGS